MPKESITWLHVVVIFKKRYFSALVYKLSINPFARYVDGVLHKYKHPKKKNAWHKRNYNRGLNKN